MKFASLAVVASSPFAVAVREIVDPARQDKYTSGAVMDGIMEKKFASFHDYSCGGTSPSC